MTPAATFSHTFTEEPVKYPYHFLLHPNMVGTVSNSFSGKNIAIQS
jgi:plastocyanin